MKQVNGFSERKSAIHLLRSGLSPSEVAEQMGKSLPWVYKWRRRFQEHGDWNDLQDHSRAPQHCPHALSASVRQAVKATRSELEAEANEPGQLSYIGAYAIRNRLRQKGVTPLPSPASIERLLSQAGLTHPYPETEIKRVFPHLRPTQPHQLIQIDIVPRYLPAQGGCVSCNEAIDVVSHYPEGQQSLTKTSTDAVQFILQVFQEMGMSEYAQIDNEGCFSGGSTHPGVIGKVVRAMLYLGVQPIFSPYYCPESNAYVERFHRDYLKNTWDKEDMLNLPQVQAHSAHFYEVYRHSGHHSALNGQTPAEVHWSQPVMRLPKDFALPSGKLPLTEGKVHFIRFVEADGTIRVANLNWLVPGGQIGQGVWATLELTQTSAKIRIFDTAPDVAVRQCLCEYPFPLKEPVVPLRSEFQKAITVTSSWRSLAVAFFQTTVKARVASWFSTML